MDIIDAHYWFDNMHYYMLYLHYYKINFVHYTQKFRERLGKQKGAEASTSNQDAQKRKQRGKKVDHLYSRSTTEFINCLKSLTPRQKEAVHELGFGAILHLNIKEIPGYIAYLVLKSFNLAQFQILLSGGGNLTLDEEDVHLTLGFSRGPVRVCIL